MLDDVCAVEVNVFHQRAAIFAVKNDVLLLTGRAATLDRCGECGTFGGMKNVSPSRTM